MKHIEVILLGYWVILSSSCVSTVSREFHLAQKVATSVNPNKLSEESSANPKGVNRRLEPEPTVQERLKTSPTGAILQSHQQSRQQPEIRGFYNSSMVYDYEPHKLYQVYTVPLRVTDIVLEAGEEITALSGGDTVRWEVSQSLSGLGSESRTHVLIKPRQPDLKTNLIILTSRRVYHLELHSFSNNSYMASLAWNYASPMLLFEQSLTEKPLKPETVNFNYHFVASSKPSWMPILAFDDGYKTYIRFDPSRQAYEAPALFVLSKDGSSEVVNYRSQGDYYIVDRLIDIVELRLGTEDPDVVGVERL